jgi:hypothetical protein
LQKLESGELELDFKEKYDVFICQDKKYEEQQSWVVQKNLEKSLRVSW